MDSVVLIGLVWVAVWLGHSYAYPWRECSMCKGKPKNHHRGAFNVWCPLCGGSGKRRRWGARLLGRGFGHK